MSISDTGTNKQVHLIMVTYRDIFQYAAKHKGESEGDYERRSSTVRLCPEDIKALGAKDGDPLRLFNNTGELVVRVKGDKACPQGIGFIPASPYSNRLTSYNPAKAKLPDFKRLEVLAEPAR